MKVIEHVANPAEFCKSLSALTIPNGATILSTINRSMRSYASAIVAAEYILQWVISSVFTSFLSLLFTPFSDICFCLFSQSRAQLPKGTHEWSSFLTPEELTMILQRTSVDVSQLPPKDCSSVLSLEGGLVYIHCGRKEMIKMKLWFCR